jgi:hypothetical protein
LGDIPLPEENMIVWSYVITVDAGGAPNFLPPATTMTLCKPKIRQRARQGDLVIAFNGQLLHPEFHSVRWAGLVAEVIPLGDYWNDLRFDQKKPGKSQGLPDNIYRPTPDGLEQVPNATHQPHDKNTDVGGRNSLVFGNVWYFGAAAPILPAHFGLRMPENARRGHRRTEIGQFAWNDLKVWLDAQGAGADRPARTGRPRLHTTCR